MTSMFADIKKDLKPDGALRDFYIKEISTSEWNILIATLPNVAERSVFTFGETELPLPSTFEEIQEMQERDPTVLTLWVSGQTVCCHFFVDSELELDFWPNDFQDEHKWNDLVEFFQSLVDVVGEVGIVTQENMEDHVIAKIEPNRNAEQSHPANAGQ